MAIHEIGPAQNTVCAPGMARITAKNKQKLLKSDFSEATWLNTVHAVAKNKVSLGIVLWLITLSQRWEENVCLLSFLSDQ